mgnify:CR=1 FL=1
MEEKVIDKNKSGMPVASLTLGIVSIVLSTFWYISLLAIVFGAKSIKKMGSKLGKAGMILGIIGLSILLLIYVSITAIILTI